jgi:hypothetical protein
VAKWLAHLPFTSKAGFPPRIFHLSLVSQLEPSGTNWIKTKENFASREKIRKSSREANLLLFELKGID